MAQRDIVTTCRRYRAYKYNSLFDLNVLLGAFYRDRGLTHCQCWSVPFSRSLHCSQETVKPPYIFCLITIFTIARGGYAVLGERAQIRKSKNFVERSKTSDVYFACRWFFLETNVTCTGKRCFVLCAVHMKEDPPVYYALGRCLTKGIISICFH